jgi:putative redox protein
MAVESQRFTFANQSGEELAAALELPAGPPRATAVFAHCFTCSKDIIAASRVSRALCEEGFAVLRFDFTGLGNSQGDFANTNFSSNVSDLEAASAALAERVAAPSLLVGHSLGGAAVAVAAHRVESVRAVVTIAAPSDPTHVAHLFRDQLDAIDAEGAVEVQLAGRPFRITRQFVTDLESHNVERALKSFRGALLVMHSPVDETVSIEHARALFDAARHPKSFVALDGADHLLRDKRDARFVARTIATWATRYVGEADPAAPEARLPDGVTEVHEAGPPYLQHIRAGRHRWVGDEPTSVGGGDAGPTPYDLLLSALGACTTMTIRMYANRKQWPLEGVDVHLSHQKIHARDCDTCETDTGMVSAIDREITLRGPLDDEQRARLLQIADRCPVHRTMTEEKTIRTRLADRE